MDDCVTEQPPVWKDAPDTNEDLPLIQTGAREGEFVRCGAVVYEVIAGHLAGCKALCQRQGFISLRSAASQRPTAFLYNQRRLGQTCEWTGNAQVVAPSETPGAANPHPYQRSPCRRRGVAGCHRDHVAGGIPHLVIINNVDGLPRTEVDRTEQDVGVPQGPPGGMPIDTFSKCGGKGTTRISFRSSLKSTYSRPASLLSFPRFSSLTRFSPHTHRQNNTSPAPPRPQARGQPMRQRSQRGDSSPGALWRSKTFHS